MYKLIWKKIIEFKIPLFIFASVAIFISGVWFRDNKLLASGEEGIPFSDPAKMVSLYSNPWYNTGTGYPIPIVVPRVTFYGLASLVNLVFPNWATQKLIFGLLIFVGTFSTYLLVNLMVKKDFVSTFAALFYMFNLYTMSQVWNRFLYVGMTAWAYLPLFLLLWIKYLEEKKWFWLSSLALSTVVFSNAFGHPAFLFTLWTPVVLYFFTRLVKNRFRPRRDVLNFLKGAILIFIVNAWWLYPYIKLGNSTFSDISNWKANFDSLLGVSKYFPTKAILILNQTFLFGKNFWWFGFYTNPWTTGLSILILAIVITGWVKSYKHKAWVFLTSLAVVGWFISKGSNPPFGKAFFGWLFSTIPSSAVLRNPYEKFGIVWLLPYSVFFALGLPKIKNKLLRIFILFLACGVLVWPIWTGRIMKNKRVSIPDYYQEANSWLNQEAYDARLFHVPATVGDGMTYSWNYNGVEPSEFLFDKASVSKILRTKYFDAKYQSLLVSFNENTDFQRIFREMNIGYIILHKDIDASVPWGDYKKPEVVLKSARNIMLAARFGDLDIYKFDGLGQNSLFETSEGSLVIRYTKINPRHYKVFIKGATKPFSLNFKTTFNDSWKASINNLELKEHTLVYDYANGWRIDKEGDYTIDIVFKVWPWE